MTSIKAHAPGAASAGRQRHEHATARFDYRPEIDGLRAFAVIPVILFHAGLAGFRGGFVGVDVFFVISGYLITTLILNDKKRANVHPRGTSTNGGRGAFSRRCSS